MRKTRYFFKKTGDIKGIFHARMGMIKDRNSKDLTEGEEIKKRGQEYSEELYKKGLKDLNNHNGVVTHLEPDILEYEVNWALGSITTIKASGGDGIPAKLFTSRETQPLQASVSSSIPRELRVQRRGRQQNGKDWRSLQENWRYQENISCKDEHNEGQKRQRPNRSRKGGKNTQTTYTKKILMNWITTMVWSLT